MPATPVEHKELAKGLESCCRAARRMSGAAVVPVAGDAGTTTGGASLREARSKYIKRRETEPRSTVVQRNLWKPLGRLKHTVEKGGKADAGRA